VRPPPVQQPVAPIALQVTQQQAPIPTASDEVLTSVSVPADQSRHAPPSLFEGATELYQVNILPGFSISFYTRISSLFFRYDGFYQFSKDFLTVLISFPRYFAEFCQFS